jgi:GntR family transcriptional regulator
VSERAASTAAERGNLLVKELEQLVVEAKKLGLDLGEVTGAVAAHWRRLDGMNGDMHNPGGSKDE